MAPPPVPQHRHRQALQVVVLHGDGGGQAAGADGLVGGPGQGVGRATRHAVDLLALGEGENISICITKSLAFSFLFDI